MSDPYRAIIFEMLNSKQDIRPWLLKSLSRGRAEFNAGAAALADVFCRLRAEQRFHAQTSDKSITAILQEPRLIIHAKIESLPDPWSLGFALLAAIDLHRGDEVFHDDPQHPASQFGMASKTPTKLVKIPPRPR